MKPIFCDMDGVLVNQTGRTRFDMMQWLHDGRALWEFIKPLRPTILSMLQPDIYDVSAPEKKVWCARELGADVPVIVTTGAAGKSPYATPGAILIDDGAQRHREEWVRAGGLFVHHRNAVQSIGELKALL